MSDSGKELEKQATNFGIKAVKDRLNSDAVKKAFENVLQQEAGGFLMSVTNLVSKKEFDGVEVSSVLGAAMIAATLRLPVVASLGFAAIIPYWNSKARVKQGQFQVMKDGYIQLALRTGAYNVINAGPVYRGELLQLDRKTGEIELDPGFVRGPDSTVMGYFSYLRLNGGFEHALYMSQEELIAHGKRYSQSYESGLWTKDPEKMYLKTVLKLNIKHYGIMSTQLNMAQTADQSVAKLNDAGEVDFGYADGEEPEKLESPKSKEEDIKKKLEGEK
jgi:recombination protein RecT